METKVEFWFKDEPKKIKSFASLKEAQAFMSALADNPLCEAYGITRN